MTRTLDTGTEDLLGRIEDRVAVLTLSVTFLVGCGAKHPTQ